MLITNFSSGELSPKLSGRADLAQYYSGAASLLNFDVIPTGGIERRNGTRHVGTLDAECRLIPFIVDKDTSFVLELVPGAMYFWGKNSATGGWEKLKGADGVQPLALETPWASLSEIREVQYCQNYDTLIFCQQDHTPWELVYAGAGIFRGGDMSFDFSPDVELDDDYGWIPVYDTEAERDAHVPGEDESGMCVYGGYLWVFDEDTGKWVLDDGTTEYSVEDGLFTTEGKYPAACAFFNSRLFFASTRTDRQKVWASSSPDISGTRYNDFSMYTKYITVNKVVKDPDIHFFTADTDAESDTDDDSGETTWTGDRLKLNNVTHDLTACVGYYVTSSVTSTGTTITAATWDSSTGKGTVTLSSAVIDSGEALVFSAQTWQERTTASAGDYEYKVVNNNMTRADDAFYFEVASDQNDAVKWLATSEHLVIGTESSCFVMASSSSATGQTVVMNGRHGTDDMQATTVDRAVIYFSQGKRGIREFYCNNDEEVFRSNDIAIFCPEILSESAACDFDYMTNPYARLLVTREDGTMGVLLYEKNNGVQAWGRLALGGGSIRSVAVVRSDGGSDLVFLCVERRTRDGSALFCLELLDYMPESHGEGSAGLTERLYLDGARPFSPAVGTADFPPDAVIYNMTSGGTVAVPEWEAMTAEEREAFIADGDTAYIGWTFASTVRSMPVIDGDVTGKKRITKLLVRFYDSWKPRLQVAGRADEQFTDFAPPFSGIKGITYPGNTGRDVTFTLTADGVRPCTVLSVDAVLSS